MKFLSVVNVDLKVIARKDYTSIQRKNMQKSSIVKCVIEFLTVRQRAKFIERLIHSEVDLSILSGRNRYVKIVTLNAHPFILWKFTLESALMIIWNAGFVIRNLKF